MIKAGRELDALVAEKVMGWKSVDRADEKDGGDFYGVTIRDGLTAVYRVPLYSVDIAAAWEVVEKCSGPSFWIERHPNAWQVCFYELGDSHAKTGLASSAPWAICLAALKAVGYKEKP